MSISAMNEGSQLHTTQGIPVPSTASLASNATNQPRQWFCALRNFVKNCVSRVKIGGRNERRSGNGSQGYELGAARMATSRPAEEATTTVADGAVRTDSVSRAGRRRTNSARHTQRVSEVVRSAASFVAHRASTMMGNSRGGNVLTAQNIQVDSGAPSHAPSNWSSSSRSSLEAGSALDVGVSATFNSSRMSSRYLVQQVVGRGGNSTVYAAEDDRGQMVALKVMRKEDYQGGQRVMLLREVQVQSKMSHPNILSLYGMFADAEHVYVAMEYAPRGDLLREICRSDSGLDERQAATYTRHIAEALRLCHAKGVVHRDVKPENVIIGVDGVAKLADFGWCLPPSTGGRSGLVRCGTPDFHAPEMDGRNLYGKEIDMWALGLIIVEMLYRERPEDVMRGPSWARWVRLPRKGSVSADARNLIRGLLRRKARKRLTAEEVVAHPWVVRNSEAPG